MPAECPNCLSIATEKAHPVGDDTAVVNQRELGKLRAITAQQGAQLTALQQQVTVLRLTTIALLEKLGVSATELNVPELPVEVEA